MLTKISTKHQVVIPKEICILFGLTQGDYVEFRVSGKRIIMEPKEVIVEDKYPMSDLMAAEKVLTKGLTGEEKIFKSSDEFIQHLKKRIKKK